VLESGRLPEEQSNAWLELRPELAIPATLQGSLMARLDRLGPAKAVAQLGAVLGREFPYPLLEAVSPLDAARLEAALARLVDAELLYPRGAAPHAVYTFKHALIRDTAYQSLLKKTRQEHHERTARALEERFTERVAPRPEVVAHHYAEAGLAAAAIGHYQRAGERAQSHFAYAEAIAHLQRAIELLHTLPASIERDRRELTVQMRLAGAFAITRGVSSPEAEQPCRRARHLSEQLRDARELFRSLFGLHEVYFFRSAYDAARELAEEMLRRARDRGDPHELVVALWMTGVGSLHRGEFSQARALLEEGIGHYGSLEHSAREYTYTRVDPGISVLGNAARALFHLGYPDQALARIREAQALARKTSDPFNQAGAAFLASIQHLDREDPQAALEEAEGLLALAREHAFLQYLGLGASLRAHALALAGQLDEGISGLRAVLDAMRASGSETPGSSGALAALARALGKVGRAEEGLAVSAEARSFVARSGERFREAEVHRVEGELLLALPTPEPARAEAAFHEAVEVSRRQGARSLELRAATSLARLLRDQNRRDEVRALLAPVYAWFTEGFDTADLKDAKALLEELS
jgi:predicted ATPase